MFSELTPAYLSALNTAAILAVLCFGISFFSVLTIEETYGKELDYLEMKDVRASQPIRKSLQEGLVK